MYVLWNMNTESGDGATQPAEMNDKTIEAQVIKWNISPFIHSYVVIYVILICVGSTRGRTPRLWAGLAVWTKPVELIHSAIMP